MEYCKHRGQVADGPLLHLARLDHGHIGVVYQPFERGHIQTLVEPFGHNVVVVVIVVVALAKLEKRTKEKNVDILAKKKQGIRECKWEISY